MVKSAKQRREDESNLSDLTHQRLAVVDRYNTLKEKLLEARANNNKDEAEVLLQGVQDKMARIEEMDNDILRLMESSQKVNEINEQEKLREEISRLVVETKRFLKPAAREESTGPRGSTSAARKNRIKLQAVKLTKFRGEDPEEWQPWWEHFSSTIHLNEEVGVEDKIQYLYMSVEGPALELVGGWSKTVANYPAVIKLLEDTYGRVDVIKSVHFAGLNSLPDATQKGDHKALRKLYNTAVRHIRSLTGLGVETSTYSSIIKPAVLTRIPTELVVNWTKDKDSTTKTLEELLDYIKEEVEAREMVAVLKKVEATSQGKKGANNGSGKQQPQQQQQPQQGNLTLFTANQQDNQQTMQQKPAGQGNPGSSKKSVSFKREKRKPKYPCLFCGEEHFPIQCQVAINLKHQQIQREKRCENCLNDKHKTAECTRPNGCRNASCGAKHHTVLCPKPRQQTTGIVPTSSRPDATYVATGPGGPTAGNGRPKGSILTNVALANQVFGGILLKTASIWVDGPEGSVRGMGLFDNCSHRTYVDEETSRETGLVFDGEESLSVQTFGSEKTETKDYTRRKIRIRGTFPGAKTVEITALDKDYIAQTPAYYKTSFAEKMWLGGNKMADDRLLWNDIGSSKVILLIGSDHYADLVENEIISSGHGLTAYSSKLGWLLHGPVNQHTSQQVNCVLTALAHSEPFSQKKSIQLDSSSRANNSIISMHVQAVGAEKKSATIIELDAGTDEDEDETKKTNSFDLRAFWSLENLGIMDPVEDPTAQDFINSYEPRISKDQDGRFIGELPFKSGFDKPGAHKELVEGRLTSLLRKLRKTPELLSEYHAQIQGNIDRGFIADANPKFNGFRTFLPHHPVIKPDRATTKIRPVFDASAKTKFTKSLNECLEAGPNLNPDILSVLLRFRMHPVAWIADVEKAFHQIKLAPNEEESICFLWPRNPHEEKSEVRTLAWKVVLFGLTSSPFMLRAVLDKHFKSYEELFPDTVQLLRDQLYVDDVIGGAGSPAEAIERSKEMIAIFNEAKMPLRKWLTNDPQLQQHYQGDLQFEQLEGVIGQSMSGQYAPKVLGLLWDPEEDYLSFNPEQLLVAAASLGNLPTKRQILKISYKLFDPLGLLGPVVIQLKLLFQSLASEGGGWDDAVTDEQSRKWISIINGLEALKDLRIPRWVQVETKRKPVEFELHAFGDASFDAYGAAVYIRFVQEGGGVITRLLCSKTRVAPLPYRSMKLPKLELLAAMLAAKLCNYVVKALRSCKIKCTLWTDSTVTLAWIQGNMDDWKVFVRNRVREIRKVSSPDWWKHCPGVDNPADLASRGAPASMLVKSKLWWEGAPWLKLDKEHHPQSGNQLKEEEEKEIKAERKSTKQVTINLAVDRPRGRVSILNPKDFSSFRKLCKQTAFLFRYIDNCRFGRPEREEEAARFEVGVNEKVIPVESLRAEEIAAAEYYWIRMAQQDCYEEEFKQLASGRAKKKTSALDPLRPILDRKLGLIRVTGRIELSLEERNKAPPILLPNGHEVVQLLIQEAHQKVFHSGVRATLAEIRDRFWLIKGRQQVKSVVGKCLICRKLDSRPFDQPPAPLPLDRITESDPFRATGIDFAGPIYVKSELVKRRRGREKKKNEETGLKTYIVLFTCAVTRAIHLELVPDMSVPTFILALRRFSGRKASAQTIYSDNARTFKRTEKFLKNLYSNPQIQDFLSGQRTRWKYSANLAPWWGGWWERMVRTVKDMLKKTFGRHRITYEELETTLVEIDAIINSRPLTYVTEGDGEPVPLTPAHLITGRRGSSKPAEPAPEVGDDASTHDVLIKRDAVRRKLLSSYWNRWQTEYLEDLRRFQAPGRKNRPIKEGEVVLIHDANQNRLFWKLGVVVRLGEGKDDINRLVWLRTAKGTVINRPIQQLYPLEVQAQPEGPEEPEEEDQPAQDEPNEPTQPQVEAAPAAEPIPEEDARDVDVPREEIDIRPPRENVVNAQQRQSRRKRNPTRRLIQEC